MEVIVWSRDNCPYCEMAKRLLIANGMKYEERNVTGGQWTKEDLLAAIPTARTVPQIIIDGECIGGYENLKQRLGSK